MFEMFQHSFMVQALIVALITGLLLSYLGVHVVSRGIVFVDLALGQISMLGVATAQYLEFGLTVIPIIFTLAGAILLSLINIKDKRFKREAVIGIVYAFASALTVLIIANTPHGDADIQEVLFGNILAVSWDQIALVGTIFGLLMMLHAVFYKKFIQLTAYLSDEQNNTAGKLNLWNFLFFISIGLAIVFAVKINGVILVFSYLIIPPVCGMILSRTMVGVVIIAVLVSIFGSFLGLQFSFHLDYPAGSSIVALLGVVFVLVNIVPLIKWIKNLIHN